MNNEAEAERIPREMAEERTHNGLPGTASSWKDIGVHLAGNKKTSSVPCPLCLQYFLMAYSISCL